jgi:isopentenyl phosphate kinase
MKNSITLIKIGGSLISDKNKYKSLDKRALKIICEEIKKVIENGTKIILGHGQGSYAHFPAKKYRTKEGSVNDASFIGFCETEDLACAMNRVMVRKLVDIGVKAVGVSPMTMITAKNDELESVETKTVENLLKHNFLPVVYGDVILDEVKGWTIFSTEKVLGYLGVALKSKGVEIERIIHCGETNGVYDENGKTIEEINSANFEKYKKALNGSNGVDVTGGMMHKVEECLKLAKQGIPGLIIDGIEHGSLSKAIAGEKVVGTVVNK